MECNFIYLSQEEGNDHVLSQYKSKRGSHAGPARRKPSRDEDEDILFQVLPDRAYDQAVWLESSV